MAIDEKSLLFVMRRWSRRGNYTSVERFLAFWPQASVISNAQAWKRPYRLLSIIAKRAKQDGYTSFSAGLEIASLVKSIQVHPKIVHFLYADHDYHYFGEWANIFGVKTVGTFYFSVEELERRMPNKGHLHSLDLVLATGQKQLEYLKRFIQPEKLDILPLGVDVDFFRPANDYGQKRLSNRLLQVGTNRRDHITLKKTYLSLQEKIPSVELHMVGCIEARPLFADIPGVFFYNYLDDQELLALYQGSDVLLLPLLEGGSSNALNEALSTGLPVVASDLPNLKDYVNPNCVFLNEPGNWAGMAADCQRLLTDESFYLGASYAARQFALQFSWSNIRQRLADVYSKLLPVNSN